MRSSVSEAVSKLLEELVRCSLEVFGDNLVSIVLYGSYARGEQTPSSDLDVLIVLEELPEDRFELHRLLDRVEELLGPCFNQLAQMGYRVVLSPIVLSRSQASVFRPLYIDLVFDAKILYDKNGFMKNILDKVRKKLEELGAKRVRLGKKWYVVLKEPVRFGERIDLVI